MGGFYFMNYNINENTINEAANQLVGIAKKHRFNLTKDYLLYIMQIYI